MTTATEARALWRRVSKRARCAICNRPDWCLLSVDGTAAICARVESPRRAGDAGWIHRLDGRQVRPSEVHRLPPMPEPIPIDWQGWLTQSRRHTGDPAIERLAAGLGVSTASLNRLGTVWDARSGAFGFPMYDEAGEVVGVRLRAETGAKWCVPGSHNGLFIPDGGQVGDEARMIVVCEGATDTAAMLDLELVAIGRPACQGCEAQTAALCASRDTIIIADRDEPKARPDGTTWRPGVEGAEALAAALYGKARTVKIIMPTTGKDARTWLQAGATAAWVRAVIDNARYWRPPKKRSESWKTG